LGSGEGALFERALYLGATDSGNRRPFMGRKKMVSDAASSAGDRKYPHSARLIWNDGMNEVTSFGRVLRRELRHRWGERMRKDCRVIAGLSSAVAKQLPFLLIMQTVKVRLLDN